MGRTLMWTLLLLPTMLNAEEHSQGIVGQINKLKIGITYDELKRMRRNLKFDNFDHPERQSPPQHGEAMAIEILPEDPWFGGALYGFENARLTFVGLGAGDTWSHEQVFKRREGVVRIITTLLGQADDIEIVIQDISKFGKVEIPYLIWRKGQRLIFLWIPTNDLRSCARDAYGLQIRRAAEEKQVLKNAKIMTLNDRQDFFRKAGLDMKILKIKSKDHKLETK